MTRSEALEDVHFYRQRGTEYLHVKDVSMFALIHKIYDDFEEATSILLKANEEEIHRHFMECEKFKEQLDMEKRKAYLDGSNDCFKALKEVGKLK